MSGSAKIDLYRRLPSVDELLRSPQLAPVVAAEGQSSAAEAARSVLGRLRDEIAAQRIDASGLELALTGIVEAVVHQLRQSQSYSLRPVVNATGVILHTNLGRAPLPTSAVEHIRQTALSYSNIEFDLSTGERGRRDVHVDRLFQRLQQAALGGQDTPPLRTIVVNNNAAAVLLALNSLAEGGEVIVSRGELVEIGGSFRIPDVMTKSGAVLREVGTTNRTRIADYERAITDKTRLLLRVHRSNFEITGFTEQPAIEELAALASQRNLPLMEDLGSGALFDLGTLGIGGEPGVFDRLRAGVDVVTYSGDKLLGGPQAGVITGRSDLVDGMRSNSLFRALRVDKLTYAALEATLLAYVKRDYSAIPALRMMHIPQGEIRRRAEAVARSSSPRMVMHVVDGESVIGGGSAPSALLPTCLLAVTCQDLSADQLCDRLRAYETPIVARVEAGRVLLDLRSVFPEQDELVARALQTIADKSALAP